jgi:hypothetical protein
MEASLKSKMPLRPKLRYTPTKGTLGICLRSTIGRMPSDRTSRSLDASLAIPVGVLDRQTYRGGTRGSRLCGGDRDQETENSKVCARTRDTRFIQVRVAKVVSPTSCLGDQVWRPALGVGCPRRDWGCAARYPTLLYIVQGAGS